jgi:non-canonical poly(A) RNA polymerase PAPD5/7
VPIIKFVDTYARIDIDLAFNQSDALKVVGLVKSYIKQMPALQPLVMILKTLFNQNNLSIPADGGLGSYSIVPPLSKG